MSSRSVGEISQHLFQLIWIQRYVNLRLRLDRLTRSPDFVHPLLAVDRGGSASPSGTVQSMVAGNDGQCPRTGVLTDQFFQYVVRLLAARSELDLQSVLAGRTWQAGGAWVAAGYRPVLAGRMHVVGLDQLHGYTERYVGDHSPNFVGGSPVDRGPLDGTSGPERISLVRSGAGQSAYQVHDEAVAAAAVDYLNRLGIQRRSVARLEPFSLTVGFMLPHPPYVARDEDFARYRDKVILPQRRSHLIRVRHPYLQGWRRRTGIDSVPDEETLRARAAYCGLVHRLDALIGKILAALAANDLAENTLIVYTSDHGDMQGEHGLWWKHVFYEESVRVPCILSWPGVIPPNQRCAHVVSALDVTATLLDAADAPSLPGSPGRSLLGLVSAARPTPPWEDIAFSEYCADEYTADGDTYQRMIRQGPWKLTYYHDLEPQLFNLELDPGEMTDRAQDPACQPIRQQLTAAVLADLGPEPPSPLRWRSAARRPRCCAHGRAKPARPTSTAGRWNQL